MTVICDEALRSDGTDRGDIMDWQPGDDVKPKAEHLNWLDPGVVFSIASKLESTKTVKSGYAVNIRLVASHYSNDDLGCALLWAKTTTGVVNPVIPVDKTDRVDDLVRVCTDTRSLNQTSMMLDSSSFSIEPTTFQSEPFEMRYESDSLYIRNFINLLIFLPIIQELCRIRRRRRRYLRFNLYGS